MDDQGYQKINSHPNGPATIDCDEFGDSWHDAMQKIDAMLHEGFQRILALEGAAKAQDAHIAAIEQANREHDEAMMAAVKADDDRIKALESSSRPFPHEQNFDPALPSDHH
jgi:hypothetical protein